MRDIMIKFIVLVVVWCIIFISFSFKEGKETLTIKDIKENKVEQKADQIVSLMHNGVEEQVELEKYLEGVVASEMPYTFELEALKAQCVAARTFVLQRNLKVDDTTSSQVYKSDTELIEIHQENYDIMKNKIRQAINETRGKVLTYDGKYISAMFYSSNNGTTNDASWYFKNEVPYLKSVESKWDLSVKASQASVELSVEECKSLLNVSSLDIQDITYYDNGYIKEINIGGNVFTGREVREKWKLRSSCFEYKINADKVVVATSGFGHGVGMSQYGAQGMALEGSDYKSILKHYYTEVTIESL